MKEENICFRQAQKKDSTFLAQLMMMAMGDIIYKFMGIDRSYHDGEELAPDETTQSALDFIRKFIELPSNQYSYKNCWVLTVGEEIVGMANIYDGAILDKLRKPVLEFIQTEYGTYSDLDDETEAGEYYIDTIAVYVKHRKKGYGEKILSQLIKNFHHQQGKTLGLLVELDNKKASNLYYKLGFRLVKQKPLVGKIFNHLQYV